MIRKIDLLILVSRFLKIVLPKNMLAYVTGNRLVVRRIPSIISLAGAMKSNIKATDKQLREASIKFEKTWAREF
jgi:hypothetical protein